MAIPNNFDRTLVKQMDISHWDVGKRTVWFRYNEDREVIGMITGKHIYPEQNFRAQVVYFDAQTTYNGVGSAGFVEMGEGKLQYSFQDEPKEIATLKQIMRDLRLKDFMDKEKLTLPPKKEEPKPLDDFVDETPIDIADDQPVRDSRPVAVKPSRLPGRPRKEA